MKLKSHDHNLLRLSASTYYTASEYNDIKGQIFACNLVQITAGRRPNARMRHERNSLCHRLAFRDFKNMCVGKSGKCQQDQQCIFPSKEAGGEGLVYI